MKEQRSRNSKGRKDFKQTINAYVDIVGSLRIKVRYSWDPRSLTILVGLVTIWLGVFLGLREAFGCLVSAGIAIGAVIGAIVVLCLRPQRLIKLLRRIP